MPDAAAFCFQQRRQRFGQREVILDQQNGRRGPTC
jgi:hypothetical protein